MSPTTAVQHSLPFELLDLLRHPATVYPHLFERRDARIALAFPAISGVYFAYVAAESLGLGDRVAFAATALGVLTVGATLGVIALWFAGSLPTWSSSLPDSASAQDDRMFLVFSYATWPFLPLLLVVVPLELALYGTAVFSAERTVGQLPLVWGIRVLELATILLWTVLMVRGTAVARGETTGQASRDLARWAAELAAIGVLFFLIVGASIAYW